jgi:hypothetical protein
MNTNKMTRSYKNRIIPEILKIALTLLFLVSAANAQNTVIKAGHLFDARSGKMLDNQIIVIRDGKIKEVGANPKFGKAVKIIDLSKVSRKANLQVCLLNCYSKYVGSDNNCYVIIQLGRSGGGSFFLRSRFGGMLSVETRAAPSERVFADTGSSS